MGNGGFTGLTYVEGGIRIAENPPLLKPLNVSEILDLYSDFSNLHITIPKKNNNMTEKRHQLLKVSLLLYAIVMLGNGVIYLFFPEWEIKSSGSVPFPPGWIRWVGALFAAIGIGSLMVYRKPEKQGIFVTTLCIMSFLYGLTLIYTVLFEYEEMGNMLRSLIPAIVILIISLLFFISLRKSKEILW